jgi:hypothetical protein
MPRNAPVMSGHGAGWLASRSGAHRWATAVALAWTKSVFGSSKGRVPAGANVRGKTTRNRQQSSPLAASVSRQAKRIRLTRQKMREGTAGTSADPGSVRVPLKGRRLQRPAESVNADWSRAASECHQVFDCLRAGALVDRGLNLYDLVLGAPQKAFRSASRIAARVILSSSSGVTYWLTSNCIGHLRSK